MAKTCIRRLHGLQDESLIVAITTMPQDTAKQNLLVCHDETVSSGMGFYDYGNR